MDISKEYIKMCDCPEIQRRSVPLGSYVAVKKCCWFRMKATDLGMTKGKWGFLNSKPTTKDKVWAFSIDPPYTAHNIGTGYGGCYRKDFIWLPRQDQIQEMAGLPVSAWGLFYGWVFEKDEDGKEPWQDFTTGEQLWLAFYMNEKHGKRWIAKKWIK